MAADDDLTQHLTTWHNFTRLVQWVVAGAIVVVVLLALITL